MKSASITLFTPNGSRAYLSAGAGSVRRTRMTGTLDEAFTSHRPALLRYFRARGANEEAEDLLQDLWVKLSAATDVAPDDALAYLYRMAHNLMLDRRRAALRRRRREEDYHDLLGDTDETPDAEHVLLARERLRHVDRLLASLGPRTDYIFRRHRVEGIAQKDIAAELGVTLSAIEKHLQKAYRAVATSSADPDASAQRPLSETRDDRR